MFPISLSLLVTLGICHFHTVYIQGLGYKGSQTRILAGHNLLNR
jgi:hypothetical protein